MGHMDTSSTHTDVLVIGFGKAGKTIAMNRAAAGDDVILLEQSPDMYGGTCINIGCVPTKTLLTDSERGVAYPDARTRRDTLIGKLNSKNLAMAEGKGVKVITGHGRFTGPKSVTVTGGDDELLIDAETIIINTGAVPVIPNIPGTDLPQILDSTSAQKLEKAPRRLAIIGGGPIGLEFATMFNDFGSEVTVIDTSEKLLSATEKSVAEMASKNLKEAGIRFVQGASVTGINDVDGTEVEVQLDGDSITADNVLIATGRKPATEGLDLDAAGIKTTDRGAVVVDERLRTNVDGVYAAGDVNGGPQFTYVSFDDHRVILSDRWGDGQRTTSGRLVPTTVFIDPPLSSIGLTEDEAREKGYDVEVRDSDIADIAVMPRPKIVGNPAGRAVFVLERDTNRILGATLYCVDSQELINTVALAMRADITAAEVGSGIYTHPSSSEVFNALLA